MPKRLGTAALQQSQGKWDLPMLTGSSAGLEQLPTAGSGEDGSYHLEYLLEITLTTRGYGIRRDFPHQLPHSASPY